MKYIQRREPGSRSGSENLRRFVLAVRDEQANRRMALEALDVPSVTRKEVFPSTLGERPDAHSRVVAGCGEACVVRRETETTYGFLMRGPCCEVVCVFGDSRFVCGRGMGTSAVGGQRADGSIVRL